MLYKISHWAYEKNQFVGRCAELSITMFTSENGPKLINNTFALLLESNSKEIKDRFWRIPYKHLKCLYAGKICWIPCVYLSKVLE